MRKLKVSHSLFLFLCLALISSSFAQTYIPLSEQVEKIHYLNRPGLRRGHRNAAYGLDVNSTGKIYLGDFYHHVIIIFDKDLKELGRIKARACHGVDIDGEDNIYVSTYRTGRVFKFNPQEVEIENWDKELIATEKIKEPVAVEFDQHNNVYIAEYTGSIIKASPQGEFLSSFDMSAFQEKGIFRPHGFFIEGNKVYVAARSPYPGVHIFDTNGKYLKSWDHIDFPFDPVAIRPFNEKYLLVPNYSDSSICVFDRKGRYFGSLGRWGEGQGLFLSVMNVLVVKGLGYFVEEKGNRIQKINLKPVLKNLSKPSVKKQ